MVRRLSSLDHLSAGRIAWNIVSSYSKSEWDAYGAEMTKRSGRYERMKEYMALCYKLWDSWVPDTIIGDRATGAFAYPAKIHQVNHRAQYCRCQAPSLLFRTPPGQP